MVVITLTPLTLFKSIWCPGTDMYNITIIIVSIIEINGSRPWSWIFKLLSNTKEKCAFCFCDSNLLIYQCEISYRWFFGVLSISGVFAVTFSVVFAYVADCTDENDRTMSYGVVSVFICMYRLLFCEIITFGHHTA